MTTQENVRFHAFAATYIRIACSWSVVLLQLVKIHRRFFNSCRHHHHHVPSHLIGVLTPRKENRIPSRFDLHIHQSHLYQAFFLSPDSIPETSVNLHDLTLSKSPEAPDSNTGRYVIQPEEWNHVKASDQYWESKRFNSRLLKIIFTLHFYIIMDVEMER